MGHGGARVAVLLTADLTASVLAGLGTREKGLAWRMEVLDRPK